MSNNSSFSLHSLQSLHSPTSDSEDSENSENSEDSEEWYEDEDEDEDEDEEPYINCVWKEELSQEEFKEKQKIVSRSIIPDEVFTAMSTNEIVDYILEKGEEPRSFHYKPFLVKQAIQIQQDNLDGVFALFQLQREKELYISTKEIAMVEEREKQRSLWMKRILKTPPALPFPVIECLLKHVLLLNDLKTVNNIRRVSREIKVVIESEPYISIIRQQSKQRKFNESLSLYNSTFSHLCISPFNRITWRNHKSKLKALHMKLSKIDLQIAHKFMCCFHRHKNIYLGCKRFQEYCVQNRNRLEKCVLDDIKTL